MEVIQAEFEAWRGQRSLEDDLLILLEVRARILPCVRASLGLAGSVCFNVALGIYICGYQLVFLCASAFSCSRVLSSHSTIPW